MSLTSVATVTHAQIIGNFDTETRVELLGSNVIPPGQLRLAKVIFINNGPDLFPGPSSVSTQYLSVPGSRTLEIVRVPQTAPCDIFTQDLGPYLFPAVLGTSPLVSPGQRTECIVGIRTFPEATVEFTQSFHSGFSTDLNPANNFFDLTIRTEEIKPTQLPTLNSTSTLFLAAGALLLGMVAVRRWS